MSVIRRLSCAFPTRTEFILGSNNISSFIKVEKHDWSSNKNISVLIGDFYQSMAIITNSILESVGCKTTIVPNGNSLIQEFKENPNGYDAIITNNTYSNGDTGKKILQLAKKLEKI